MWLTNFSVTFFDLGGYFGTYPNAAEEVFCVAYNVSSIADNSGVFTSPTGGYYVINAQIRLDLINGRHFRLSGASMKAIVLVRCWPHAFCCFTLETALRNGVHGVHMLKTARSAPE